MKKIHWPILAVAIVAISAFIYRMSKEGRYSGVDQAQVGTQVIKNSSLGADKHEPSDVQSAIKFAIKEMAPDDPSLLKIAEGDIPTIKAAYKKYTGLNLKELRKNPDGTYDAVIAGGEEIKLERESLIENPKKVEEFRQAYIDAANGGKKVKLDERDQLEIQKFRNSLKR